MTDDQVFHARRGSGAERAHMPSPAGVATVHGLRDGGAVQPAREDGTGMAIIHGTQGDTVVRAFQGAQGDDPDKAAAEHHRDRLHWVLDHLPASRPGRPIAVLDLGCATGDLSLLLAERGDRVTGVDVSPSLIARAERRRGTLPTDVAARLSFLVGDGHTLGDLDDDTFDAAAVSELLDQVGDPVQVLGELHRMLRPGATLVFTVPYGVSEHILRLALAGEAAEEPESPEAFDEACETFDDGADRRRVFYHGSLRHLVEPLFEIRELTVLRGHLVGAAVRRDDPRGTPGFALSRAETAFLQRERLLHGEIADLRARYAEMAAHAGTLQRAGEDLLGRNAELRAEATLLGQRVKRLEDRLAEYREVIARLRRSRAWRLITTYRRLRYPSGRELDGPGAAKRPVVIKGSAADVTRAALPGGRDERPAARGERAPD